MRGVVEIVTDGVKTKTIWCHAACYPLDKSSGRNQTTRMDSTPEKQLEALIARLAKIACKNNDQFQFRIEMQELRGTMELRYKFICEERSDHHEFTCGIGRTIEAAVKSAEDGIPEALKQWGYKDAK